MLLPDSDQAPLRRTRRRWSRSDFESNLTTMRSRWGASSKHPPSLNSIDGVRTNHAAGGCSC